MTQPASKPQRGSALKPKRPASGGGSGGAGKKKGGRAGGKPDSASSAAAALDPAAIAAAARAAVQDADAATARRKINLIEVSGWLDGGKREGESVRATHVGG